MGSSVNNMNFRKLFNLLTLTALFLLTACDLDGLRVAAPTPTLAPPPAPIATTPPTVEAAPTIANADTPTPNHVLSEANGTQNLAPTLAPSPAGTLDAFNCPAAKGPGAQRD